jgi:trans-aconitate methyltransferase
VIISNATLQWIPRHRDWLPSLISSLASDGWLAFQAPGNFDEPSHRLLRQLSADPRYAPPLTDVSWPAVADATSYLDDLAGLGCSVDAWETTYFHVLNVPDPVFRWMSGTGAPCSRHYPGIVVSSSSPNTRSCCKGTPDSAVRDRSAFSAYFRRRSSAVSDDP